MANHNTKPAKPATLSKSIAKRIHDQRGEMFSAMAVIAVMRDSISIEEDCDRHIALRDVYKRLDLIAWALCRVAEDMEVSHG